MLEAAKYPDLFLCTGGILTNCASFSGKKTHQRHPSEDFILGTNINLNTIQSSVAKMKIQNQNASVSSTNQNSTDQLTVCDSDTSTGQVSKTDPEIQNKTCQDDKDLNVHQAEYRGQMDSSDSNQVKDVGDNTQPASTNKEQPLSNLPPSLADLQNPNTFSLEATPPSKRKITKSSFLNPSGQLAEKSDDPNDPLNSLDPLWTIKQDKA